jgi:hypothetical protein
MDKRVARLEELVEGIQHTLDENRNKTSHEIELLRDQVEENREEFSRHMKKGTDSQRDTNLLLENINRQMARLMLILNVFMFISLCTGGLFLLNLMYAK